MIYYLVFFVVAGIASFLLTPWAIWIAKKFRAIRYPPSLAMHKVKKERSVDVYVSTRKHFGKPPTPLMGGLAYVLTFFILVAVGMVFSDFINFGASTISAYFLWFIGALILFVTGIVVDKKDISSTTQLFMYFVAIFVFILSTFDIVVVNIPFLGNVHVDWWFWQPFRWLSLVFPGDLITLGLIFIMLYALKFQAGVDGLMEGNTIVGLLFVFASALMLHHSVTAFMAIVLAGALLGFLFYNFYPARVFSGATGKSIVGYLVATLAIIGEAKLVVILGVFALPVLDMIYVLVKRFLRYKSVKKALITSDRTHFHHNLLALGLTERQVCLFEYTYTAVSGLILVSLPMSLKTYGGVAILLITLVLIIYVNIKNKASLK